MTETLPRFFRPAGATRALLLGMTLVVLKANSQAASDATDEDILKLLAPEFGDARLLTMQDLTRVQAENVGDTPGIGRRFEADLDGDGRLDLALFGAHAGGTFVVVASGDQGEWHRSGLLQFTNPFIVGREDQGRLWIFFCTGCDSGGQVVWNSTEYEFVPFPEFGVPE